ncbi:hypothetical protein BT63DRAFT_444057 [Microthyrium microscopicum]|uniref:EthD domain-containing protein n=1 Tax=Microthyrium microscopicum TaxID=703497 RepID=A0A6A6TWW3_9PEZI|nr:hypothetical protein BT63DRAFT_444057 [Microthyrium microscopicum]
MTLTKLDHRFGNEQLSYDAKPNYQPYVKLTFFFSKGSNISDEQFHRHWETVHADLTVASKDFRVNDLRRYVQFHQTQESKEKVKSMGMDLMDVDGCSEIWVKDWDSWERFLNSPEYAKALGPDCKNFMGSTIKVMAGMDNLIYGKAVPSEGGSDGIQFH